jgi:hypothetical protein
MKFTKLLSIAGLFVAGLFACPETSQAKLDHSKATMSPTSCKMRCIPLACQHDPVLAQKCIKECKKGTVENCKAAFLKAAQNKKLPSATCTFGCTADKCGKNPSLARQCINGCPEKQVKNCKKAHDEYKDALEAEDPEEEEEEEEEAEEEEEEEEEEE